MLRPNTREGSFRRERSLILKPVSCILGVKRRIWWKVLLVRRRIITPKMRPSSRTSPDHGAYCRGVERRKAFGDDQMKEIRGSGANFCIAELL